MAKRDTHPTAEKAMWKDTPSNFRSILDSMQDGVYIVDQNYNIQYVNPALIAEFGPYKGKKCCEYFHDRKEPCPWCKNEEVWAGKTVRWEWYSFKNNKIYDLIDTPLKNQDGTISKLEIFRDITERKQVEEELRTSKDFLDATGRIAKIGGWEMDVAIMDAKWTEAIFCLFELPVGDRPPPFNEQLKFFHPDDVPKLTQVMQRASEHGEPYDIKLRVITAKGSRIWTHAICTPIIKDGKTVKLTGTFQDITEQKKAEDALIESEEKHRVLFESSRDAVMTLAPPSWKFTSGNPATIEIFMAHDRGSLPRRRGG